MTKTDQRIIRLIELLIFQKQISYVKDFCHQIGVLEQTITKINNGTSHFTVYHIEMICKIYNVNANWIFGVDKKVFNNTKSIEIATI